MDQILQGIPGVECYLDDILISAPSESEHWVRLNQVFQRLEKYGVRVKKQKCEIGKPSVVYLGHKIDGNGIHPTSDKVEAIAQASSPTNITELRSYLGLLNYYGKFFPNVSTVINPLNALLRKQTPWCWDKGCEVAFQNSKKLILDNSLLVHYDVNRELRLACDASPYGVGAVISHIMPNGKERPIAFASRTLSNSEQNYAQIEREALSIVYGVRKFHKYLYGRRFVLITDHKPLTAILNPESPVPTLAAARMQRWALLLSAYKYDIVYRKSNDHCNADMLSRLPTKDSRDEHVEVNYFSYVDDLPITANDIGKATIKDPLLAKVYDYVLNGWPNHVKDKEIQPFFIRRNELSVDKRCILWELRVVIPGKFRSTLLNDLHEQHLGICRMKGLARSYLWWPGLDQGASPIVVVPKGDGKVRLCGDYKVTFISSDFAEFMNRNGIIHKRVAPYHPASNGAAERTVQIVKAALIKQLLDPNPRKRNLSLHHKLANFLITYRNSPHTTTGRTPAELFLKRQPRTRFSLLKPNLAQEIDRKQAKQTEYHDKGRVQERILHVDDRVRVKSNVGGLVKWLPGKVTKVCGSRTYLVYMYNNCKIRFVHIDHILSSKEKGVPCKSADNPSVDVQVPLISPEGLPIEVLDGPEKSENGKGTPGQKDQVPLSVGPQIADIQPSPLVPSAGIAQERRYPVRVRKAPDRLNL
ncbi:uncharacterized protein K02A2.6-like [Anneissia japonica]|uniref:uncharacterized protein K02A2.6-like n=1 Tax=Anneissia japonica TaxID=1529436 RepID=UPI001425BB3A|nr:uncharacterized protein K02A2.6-like [Anneissia japonica]